MARYESIPDLIASYKTRFIPENAKGVDTVIQLQLSGESPAAFYMIIRNQECVIEDGNHADPLLTVRATTEDWLKLNNHEVNPMMLMMQGKIAIDGPLHMATKFQTMFRDKVG